MINGKEYNIVVERIYNIIKTEKKFMLLSEIYEQYESLYDVSSYSDYQSLIRKKINEHCLDRDLLKNNDILFFSLKEKQKPGNKYGIIDWFDKLDTEITNNEVIKRHSWLEVLKNEISLKQKGADNFMPFLEYLYYKNDYSETENNISKDFNISVKKFKLILNSFSKRINNVLNLTDYSNAKEDFCYWNLPLYLSYTDKDELVYTLKKQMLSCLMVIDLDHIENRINHGKLNKNVKIVNWDYNEKVFKKDFLVHRHKQDYIRAQKNKSYVGSVGEEIIINFEKERLKKLKLFDYIDKVIQVSMIDDSYGYDIESYDIIDGKIVPIYIEVKTTVSKNPILEFYITDNEWRMFNNEKNHRIYYLYDINDEPKLHIIDKNNFKSDFLEPVLYKVKVSVTRKE